MAGSRRSSVWCFAPILLWVSLGCGRASHDLLEASNLAGSGGALANSNGGAGSPAGGATPAGEGGAHAASGGSAGAPDFSVALDVSDCAARPLSDCQGVDVEYGANGNFERTPALAQCGRFMSYDGCGVLEFAFDAEGCAVSVSPGANGWKNSLHLSDLQGCLTDALAAARYACLASGTLTYHESCYVRSR